MIERDVAQYKTASRPVNQSAPTHKADFAVSHVASCNSYALLLDESGGKSSVARRAA
jgi:hypothetical protein